MNSGPHGGRGSRRAGAFLAARSGWLVLIVIFLSTSYVAVSVVIRGRVLDLRSPLTDSEQFKALWTFIAAGLTASVSLAAALLSDARQREVSERQTLEVVTASLKLISEPGACPQAVSGGALATITYLGHPTIAMRALSGALNARAVDRDTTAWLLGWVLGGQLTTGTSAERARAREEAAALLRSTAKGSGFTYHDYPGALAWPDALHCRWPHDLSPTMNLNAVKALAWLLVSEDDLWWDHPRGTAWIRGTAGIASRQEVTTGSEEASVICRAIECVLREGTLAGLSDPGEHLDPALLRALQNWSQLAAGVQGQSP